MDLFSVKYMLRFQLPRLILAFPPTLLVAVSITVTLI